MDLKDIATNRLINQQVTETKFSTVKDVVGWMGAMQAQNFGMAQWAVGIRLARATEQMIETAVNSAEIIRTHLLRPTWHLVSADDIYWLLELTAQQIKAISRANERALGLSEADFMQSNEIIARTLSGGKHLTRSELAIELEKAGFVTQGIRMSHFLMWAELDGIICSGAAKGGKQTYALLAERVPKPNRLTREEALAALAKRYFASHGPATLQDFVWWSGLSVSEARQALELIKAEFVSERIDDQTYWFSNTSLPEADAKKVHFLPAFDEFIISYRDRKAALPAQYNSKVITQNGIFRPVIVVNGQVIGLWERTIKKDKVIVKTDFFHEPNKPARNLIEDAARQFGGFLEKETELIN